MRESHHTLLGTARLCAMAAKARRMGAVEDGEVDESGVKVKAAKEFKVGGSGWHLHTVLVTVVAVRHCVLLPRPGHRAGGRCSGKDQPV